MDSVDYKELSKSGSQSSNVPWIARGAILMSEGIWNEMYYGKDEILKAFNQTDWNSREKKNLFLDHKDDSASEWIGDVQNMNFKDDTLYGDLYVYDPIWAAKLKYGNPKVGISPKVMGDADEKNKIMSNFTFENFSVVMNPAIKKAYINNMEKLKIDEDESVEGVVEDSKKVEIENKIKTEEKPKEAKSMDDSTRDLTDLFELFESKNLSVTKVLKKADEIREEKESLKDSLRRAGRILEEEAVTAEAEAVKEEAKVEETEEKAPAKEEPKVEEAPPADEPAVEEEPAKESVEEMKEVIKELSKKVEKLSNEPNVRELKKTEKELTSKDADENMMKFLQKLEVDSTNVA